MKSFLGKIQRMPLWIILLVGALIALTIYSPFWLGFAFLLIIIGLFCPNFNTLGGSCNATLATDIRGWAIMALIVIAIAWVIFKIIDAWRKL